MLNFAIPPHNLQAMQLLLQATQLLLQDMQLGQFWTLPFQQEGLASEIKNPQFCTRHTQNTDVMCKITVLLLSMCGNRL